MSAALTIEREFNGRSVSLIEREGGEVWMAADQVAVCLGYSDRRGAIKLASRHEDELDGHKGVVKLATPGGVQEVTAFDEHGLYVMAFHAKTDAAKAFRSWLADVLRDLRSGKKALVDVEALRAQVERLADRAARAEDAAAEVFVRLNEAKLGLTQALLMVDQGKTIAASTLGLMSKDIAPGAKQGSRAGTLLHDWKEQPKMREATKKAKKIAAKVHPNQRLLPNVSYTLLTESGSETDLSALFDKLAMDAVSRAMAKAAQVSA